MTKWLHVSAINEPSSGQFFSNDQLHIDNFAHFGIPYGITNCALWDPIRHYKLRIMGPHTVLQINL
jgi:hypothetical protein